MQHIILIPAYKPQQDMLPFIDELLAFTRDIVVVDDGGGQQFAPIFDALRTRGITVLVHEVNRGKGRALKTGIRYIADNYPDCTGIITADCDGQHTVRDIKRVSDELAAHPDDLIVGGRALKENVPLRSRIGNSLMRNFYRLAARNKIHDTQTGLRGIPANMFPYLFDLSGERYEYEMNMLLYLRRWGINPREIVIDTIYIDNNSGSHYNPLMDSLRIGGHIFRFMLSSLARLIKFCFSGIISYVAEYIIFTLLKLVLPPSLSLPLITLGAIELANIIARVCSSLLNYMLNKKVVFAKNNGRHTLLKYAGLVIAILLVSTVLISLLSNAAAGLFGTTAEAASAYIKPLVDACLFVINYLVQRDLIFVKKKKA